MLSVLLFIFWIYIYNVQKSLSVRIFDNLIRTPATLFTRFQPVVISKTCMLVPEAGPCRSKITMWYFDPVKSNCSEFDWGGCQGNGNRYDSYPECWESCMSKPGSLKSRPRYCALTFDYGFCFGAVERWYYDDIWKVCKSTIYSGCGGNKNNFYNQEQCEQMCRFANAAVTTKDWRNKGTKKVLIINPVNATTKEELRTTPPP